MSASSPLFIKLVEHARSCVAASSFRFAHRVNWTFVPNQLQFVAAARAFKIAKLIARHYWFGDATQHFDVALRTGWPVVDVRAHRHHCMGGYHPGYLSSVRFPTMPLRVPSSVIFVQQNCHLDINAVPTEGGRPAVSSSCKGRLRGSRRKTPRLSKSNARVANRTDASDFNEPYVVGQLLGGYPRQHLTTVGSWGWFSTSVFAV
jgi:hypothetical protein